MAHFITIKLFASLGKYAPADHERYRIESGISVRDLLNTLNIPEDQAKLIFINSVKSTLSSVLKGGERVGIFPPVGGG
ncbi:MoaD/ThiS family protein [Desulfobacterales bacterium HSG16]|nr:MoaD/ThiS family protein [Desulfobacterales bacterium HSG16]